MDDPLSDAETLKIGPDGGIAELGKKPKSYDEIEGQYIGVMRFSPEAVGEMRALWVELAEEGPEARWDNKDRANIYMTTFLSLLRDRRGVYLQPVYIDGGWTEVDCPTDMNYLVDMSKWW